MTTIAHALTLRFLSFAIDSLSRVVHSLVALLTHDKCDRSSTAITQRMGQRAVIHTNVSPHDVAGRRRRSICVGHCVDRVSNKRFLTPCRRLHKGDLLCIGGETHDLSHRKWINDQDTWFFRELRQSIESRNRDALIFNVSGFVAMVSGICRQMVG